MTMYQKTREELQEQLAGPYNIESWYPLVKDYTMKTTFVTFTLEEAKTIQTFQSVSRLLTKIELQSQNNPQLYENQSLLEFTIRQSKERVYSFLLPEEKEKLASIEQKIKTAIAMFNNNAFIKLSSRSPKDAALTSNKLKLVLKEEIEKDIQRLNEISEIDDDLDLEDEKNLIAYTYACGKALQVTSVDDAMDLLLYSKRVDEDIGMHKLFLGEESFKMNLVIREWEDLPFLWEFRCVVFNDVVTCINHYYSNLYLRELPPLKDELSKLLLEKIEEIHPLLSLHDYTIDFAFDPSTHSLRVIEINNPPPVAGLTFLDYENEDERKLIHEGPFRFLFHTQPMADPYDGLFPLLRDYMLHLRGRLGDKKGVEKHVGVECEECKMSPLLGIRYCCIECSGGEYSVEGDININDVPLPHVPGFNLCLFCYSLRLHPHQHHFKVFIHPNVEVISLLHSNLESKNHPHNNNHQAEVNVPQNNFVSSIVRSLSQKCIIL